MPITIRPAASVLAVLLLSTAAACASAEQTTAKADAKPTRQCFWSRSVNGFSAVDDHTVNLRVGVKDVYQLELFAPCHDIDWANKIALESRNSSYICSGFDAVVIAPSSIGPQRCMVKNVRKLTPEEVAALPAKEKP